MDIARNSYVNAKNQKPFKLISLLGLTLLLTRQTYTQINRNAEQTYYSYFMRHIREVNEVFQF